MSVDLPEYVGFNADTMVVVDVENDGASKVNREAHASGAVKEREGREEITLESLVRCLLASSSDFVMWRRVRIRVQ